MKEVFFNKEWWNRIDKVQEFLLFDPLQKADILQSQMIFDFREDYRWLSNFHLHPIMVRGKWFPSSEHAYQAYKTNDSNWFSAIQSAKSCFEAKQLGGKAPLRDDWEVVKFEIMLEVLSSKFSVPELSNLLLATQNAYLVEGNYWHDNTWGVCTTLGCPKCQGKIALNWLGKALMIIRRSLQIKAG